MSMERAPFLEEGELGRLLFCVQKRGGERAPFHDAAIKVEWVKPSSFQTEMVHLQGFEILFLLLK